MGRGLQFQAASTGRAYTQVHWFYKESVGLRSIYAWVHFCIHPSSAKRLWANHKS